MKTAWIVVCAVLALAPRFAEAKDDIAVRQITEELDKMDKMIAEGNLDRLYSTAWSLYSRLELNKDPDLQSDSNLPKLVERWKGMAAKAAKAAGGHSKEILGDGKVPGDEDKERDELFGEVKSACESAANSSSTMSNSDIQRFKDAYGKYEKALARAIKADPSAPRHRAGHFQLFECEWRVQQRQMDLEDNANRDDGKAEKYPSCGYDEYNFQRLKAGKKFGQWELRGVPASNGYEMACKKHPKKQKLSGNMPALTRDFNYGKKAVWATQGKPTLEQDGLKVYQVQTVRVFAPDIMMTTNDCGSKDDKVVCEASGSKTVRAYNAITHLVGRGEFHKEGGRVDRCKRLYKEARRAAEEWTSFYESATKSGDWAKGLKYKTRRDGVLDEKKIVGKVKEMATQADERSIGSYCKK